MTKQTRTMELGLAAVLWLIVGCAETPARPQEAPNLEGTSWNYRFSSTIDTYTLLNGGRVTIETYCPACRPQYMTPPIMHKTWSQRGNSVHIETDDHAFDGTWSDSFWGGERLVGTRTYLPTGRSAQVVFTRSR